METLLSRPGHCFSLNALFCLRWGRSVFSLTRWSSASHDICITFTGAGYTCTKYPGSCQLYIKAWRVISNFN